MDEYTNNLHARIDNILSEIKNSPQILLTPETLQSQHLNHNNSIKTNTQFDFSTENSICWLIIGILVGCVVCYSFSILCGNDGYDGYSEYSKNNQNIDNKKKL